MRPILEIDNLSMVFGGLQALSDLSMTVHPGEIVALIGPNGAGKSTLIKLLAGTLPLQSGRRLPAQALRVGYFAQHQMDQLRGNDSPMAHLYRVAPGRGEQELRDFLGGFAFSGDKALAPVAPFSGGEKARLVLALLIWQRPNLLLLDEPTNHLDLEMRHTLSEALQEFEGALVVVSHDRHLLRVTSDELLLVDDGAATTFSGDLDEYPAWLAQRQVGPDVVTDAPTPPNGGSRKEKRRQEAEARSRLQPLRSRLQILDARLADLTTRHGELERELATPELYEPTAKARLLATLERKHRLDAELEQTESAWLEAGEELERQIAQTT